MIPAASRSGSAGERFGRETLGPILAEFCQRLWLLERFMPNPDDAAMLFCARGGLRLQLAYERFLTRTGLPARLPRRPLMISRLVAARSALAPMGDGLLDELGREFAGRPMCEVAAALAQSDDLALCPAWRQTFQREQFAALIAGDELAVVELRAAVAEQDARFRSHLAACMAGRRHAILVDTGLYGSTIRLLIEGVPELRWSSLLLARSNYKRLSTPHFGRTLGVSVESDVYKPWDVRSSALRYWHLIESALEPDLPSVRVFDEPRPGGQPRCNLEVADWSSRVAAAPGGHFGGALAYLDDLSSTDLHRIPSEALRSWRSYRRCVIWPNARDVAALDIQARSRDFGRTERVALFAPSVVGRLARIRYSLWREGALTSQFPRTAGFFLSVVECVYAIRAVSRQVGILLRHAGSRMRPIDA